MGGRNKLFSDLKELVGKAFVCYLILMLVAVFTVLFMYLFGTL